MSSATSVISNACHEPSCRAPQCVPLAPRGNSARFTYEFVVPCDAHAPGARQSLSKSSAASLTLSVCAMAASAALLAAHLMYLSDDIEG